MAPTLRAVLLLLAGIPAALLPALVSPALWPLWIVVVAGSIGAIGLDWAMGLPRRQLESDVVVPAALPIGGEDRLVVRLSGPPRRRPTRVELLAEVGPLLQTPPAASATLDADGRGEATIPLVPTRRGTARVAALWMAWTGPLGLVSRSTRLPLDRDVPVVANIAAVRAAAIRFFSGRELMTGLKVQHFVGDGSEFDSLREYMPGYDHRAIDWKCSARHVKLLVREFRAERNHDVYLAFDTGHLMGEPLSGIPRLDHAVTAGLALGYVSVKTGDRVGLFGFDERARLFSEAQGGVQSLHRLQLQAARLDYGASETNFTLGLTDLTARLRRRALVVVFTDFVDSISAELMMDNLGRLARRHLVLFVTFRDRSVDRLRHGDPRSLTEVARAVVAADFAREREVLLRRLERLGVACIEAPGEHIPARLIDRYLEIRRRELV